MKLGTFSKKVLIGNGSLDLDETIANRGSEQMKLKEDSDSI